MSTDNTFDAKEFRKVLGTFPTGVTIITTRGVDSAPVGITANSFNSVSLNPPMVLWSLAKTAQSRAAFEGCEYWTVHILSADQEELSNRFATRGVDKFAGLTLESGVGGVPLLTGCAARLQCKTSFMYEGGDHIIFVGEVLKFDHEENAPLVFHAGAYALATRKNYGTSGPSPVPEVEGTFGDDFLDYLLPRAHYQIYARIRAEHQRYQLSDAEYFVLVSLTVRGGRTRENIDATFSPTGHHITPDVITSLLDRKLIRADQQNGQVKLHLTDSGRDTALHVLAAAKAIESEILGKFNYWEAVSLKTLLKRLVHVTESVSEGAPSVWDPDAGGEG
jgi:3-hydroxy-9,10-secoandrosta-1,3,5(10)-triene-9,17-dione monooxygenase reductase component